LTQWAAEEIILEAVGHTISLKSRLKFIDHYYLCCGLRTIHFKTVNKFNTLLELDFVFILSKISQAQAFYFIFLHKLQILSEPHVLQ